MHGGAIRYVHAICTQIFTFLLPRFQSSLNPYVRCFTDKISSEVMSRITRTETIMFHNSIDVLTILLSQGNCI